MAKPRNKRPKDENEAHAAGLLPSDPAEGTGESLVARAHRALEQGGARLTPARLAALEAALAAGVDAEVTQRLERAVDGLRAALPPPALAARVAASLAVMMRRAAGEEKPIPTPWGPVNARLRGGLWPGLYTLTSASGMGKTQWAVDAALHAAEAFREERPEAPDRVVYIALELGDLDIMARIWGLMAANVVAGMRAAGHLEHEIRATGLLSVRWSQET